MEPPRCSLNGLHPWPFGTASNSSGQIEGTGAAPHNAQTCTDNSLEALDQTWLPSLRVRVLRRTFYTFPLPAGSELYFHCSALARTNSPQRESLDNQSAYL